MNDFDLNLILALLQNITLLKDKIVFKKSSLQNLHK